MTLNYPPACCRASAGRGRQQNPLAEAWREGFDPGVAAHEVCRVFGEAVLPYLPGGFLEQVLL